MKFKNLFGKVKKIRHTHVLAVVFVFILIYVGSAVLPDAIGNARAVLGNDHANFGVALLSLKETLDYDYREILYYRDRYTLRDRGTYIDLNGLAARVMGQRLMNRVIKLDNGHIFDPTIRIYDITVSASRLTALYERQRQYDRDFLFVLAPHQVSIFEDLMPAGFSCYANLNADNLLEALRANGVPVMDLRYELYRDGISHADAFFVTDHHWLPETGFWAYTKIFEYFVSEGILEPVDSRYTDINEFTIEVFEGRFMGSNGFRVGRFFAGVDDFRLVYPAFETDFFAEKPWEDFAMRGSFYDLLLEHQYNVPGFFTASQYRVFLPETYMIVHNDSAANSQTILTLHDSFGDACIIFFPFMARTNHFLDMRQFHDNFEAKYYDLSPDIIIVLITPDQIYTPITRYNFFNE
jgi:hypothetical protein